MKKNIKINLILLLLLQALVLHCSDPVSPIPEVDPELIGEWYKIDSISYNYPSPDSWFYGLQFTQDKKIKLLGVETNTGKVAIRNDAYRKITKANLGKMIMEYYIEGMQVSETHEYRIENEKLILTDNFGSKTYTKTKLGEQVFEPLISNLIVKIDSIGDENTKISGSPSAFVSKRSTSEFLLKSEINYGYINIEINNFIGTGNYDITFSKGELIYDGGDFFEIFVSDSILIGTLAVNQYDESTNICLGNFSFNVIVPSLDSTFIKEVEGIFSVPIYK